MATNDQPMHARSVEDLVASLRGGARPKYVFFWGHTPRVPDVTDQSCLSNWFPARFVLHTITYPTAEHYMMAEKAKLFGDEKIREKIIAANSPGKAKSLGRRVSDFDEAAWESGRFEIVVEANVAKFSQNENLGALLRATGSKVLVEASPQDRVWGIGIGRDDKDAENPAAWRGLNLLGFALMEARARLDA
jgi:ribA/ribD-fused uncharacterized protein